MACILFIHAIEHVEVLLNVALIIQSWRAQVGMHVRNLAQRDGIMCVSDPSTWMYIYFWNANAHFIFVIIC